MRLHRRRNSVIPFCRRPGTTNRATFTRPTALPQGLSLPQSRSRVAYALALLLSILMGGISAAQAQAVRSNPGFTAASIPRNDDGSTDTAIDLGFDVNFFGANFRTAFVNNNGNITFGGPLSTFTPEGLVASPLRIIAPFWADVDTRASRSLRTRHRRRPPRLRRQLGERGILWHPRRQIEQFSAGSDRPLGYRARRL